MTPTEYDQQRAEEKRWKEREVMDRDHYWFERAQMYAAMVFLSASGVGNLPQYLVDALKKDDFINDNGKWKG